MPKAKEIVSSFSQLEKMLPKDIDAERDGARLSALKHYLGKGGVLHISPTQSGWPRLLYPTKAHLRKKVAELKEVRDKYSSRLGDWTKKFKDAESYHSSNKVKKLKEPLFWKHLARCAVDRDYKKDAEKVNLPVNLVADKRWKPMVKVFLEDVEYRKQLVQTVQESIVYKEDKRVGRYADLLQHFRMEQSNRKVEQLRERVAGLEKDIEAMQQLAKWASF